MTARTWGQGRSRLILQAFLRKKAIPQALLFQGAEGIGKREAAILFSQSILCSSPATFDSDAQEIQPCGTCLSCRKMKGQNHPDFSLIEPDGKAIKIDQIREIQQKIHFKPIDGPKKILLIDPADKMNAAAANSLLKLLEEPPAHALLILLSAQAASLLPTLLSRCQKISFQAPSFSQLVSLVMEKSGCKKAEAQVIAAMANGQLREALVLEFEAAKALEAARHRLISSEDLFQTALDFSGDSDIFQQALSYLRAWFRDALLCKAFPQPEEVDPALFVFSWREDALRVWAAALPTEEIWALLSDLQAIHLAQSRNVNRQLSLETFLLKMRQSRRKKRP